MIEKILETIRKKAEGQGSREKPPSPLEIWDTDRLFKELGEAASMGIEAMWEALTDQFPGRLADETDMKWLIEHPRHPAAKQFLRIVESSPHFRLFFFGAMKDGMVPALATDKKGAFRVSRGIALWFAWNPDGFVVMKATPSSPGTSSPSDS